MQSTHARQRPQNCKMATGLYVPTFYQARVTDYLLMGTYIVPKMRAAKSNFTVTLLKP